MARRNSQTQSDELVKPGNPPAAPKAPELEPMDFDVWFSLLRASNADFREWQRPQLKAFMRSKGLSERENRAAYDTAFEQF